MDERSLRDQFEEDGFVRIEQGLPARLAAALRQRLIEDAGEGGSKRLGDYDEPLFLSVFHAPALRAALDAVFGADHWKQPTALEDVRIKAPGPDYPPWWHIDVFERGPDTQEDDALTWLASLSAGNVGALATFLFSETDDDAALTEVRVGSHHTVSARLAPAGASGLSLAELLETGIANATAAASTTRMTGPAGTVYLCHPLLIHTALPNRSAGPVVTALHPVRVVRP